MIEYFRNLWDHCGMGRYNAKWTTESQSLLDVIPTSLSELTRRDIAWIIAGMLLAYLATLL
jgi:hypothetical protein